MTTTYCPDCDLLDGLHFPSCPNVGIATDPDECPRCGHTFDCYCQSADAIDTQTPTCTNCHDAREIDPREVAFPFDGQSWPCPSCSQVLWSGASTAPGHVEVEAHIYISQGNDCHYVSHVTGDGPTYHVDVRRIPDTITLAELIRYHAGA